MLTDYKFWYIKRNDEGFITEAAVRFFEGRMQKVTFAEQLPALKYVRTRRLGKNDLTYLDKGYIAEANGNTCVLFKPTDFGQIKTDTELFSFLNKELSKDTARTPIPEQLL